jgi:hypothetical protein
MDSIAILLRKQISKDGFVVSGKVPPHRPHPVRYEMDEDDASSCDGG